jgi:hypothetical protein
VVQPGGGGKQFEKEKTEGNPEDEDEKRLEEDSQRKSQRKLARGSQMMISKLIMLLQFYDKKRMSLYQTEGLAPTHRPSFICLFIPSLFLSSFPIWLKMSHYIR